MPKHTEGKPRERRPGHHWVMDMIVFRHRSEECCKYAILLTDVVTQFYQLIPLYWKHDATHEIRRWIKAFRAHPAFRDISYQINAIITTDNESVWSEDCEESNLMVDEVGGLVMDWTDVPAWNRMI